MTTVTGGMSRARLSAAGDSFIVERTRREGLLVNAHVIRHLDSTGRTAGRTGRASVSEWDIERRARPLTADEATSAAVGQVARFERRAERMTRRPSLLGSLRAVLSPGRTAGGVIGS